MTDGIDHQQPSSREPSRKELINQLREIEAKLAASEASAKETLKKTIAKMIEDEGFEMTDFFASESPRTEQPVRQTRKSQTQRPKNSKYPGGINLERQVTYYNPADPDETYVLTSGRKPPWVEEFLKRGELPPRVEPTEGNMEDFMS